MTTAMYETGYVSATKKASYPTPTRPHERLTPPVQQGGKRKKKKILLYV
jgi:hypothetical protein